jgi:ParB-like chromosome segregation protein Spo0J
MSKASAKLHQVVQLPIGEVVDNWWNPNSETADKFNALFDSMQEYGFLENIQVVPICEELLDAFDMESDRERLSEMMSQGYKWLVVQGSHRFQAAQTAGKEAFPDVPAVVLPPRDVDRLKALSIRMNRIRGEIDPEKAGAMIEHWLNKGFSEIELMEMTGVTSRKELETLIKTVRKDLDPELRKEFDAHRDEIRTIEDLGRVLNELFTRYGDDLAYSFMTFTWGGKTHTFVRLTKQTAALLAEVKEFCRERKADINDPLGAAFKLILGRDIPWPEAETKDLSIVE